MTRAVFFGRFQPFHNGHTKVLKEIHKECDEIAIIICGPAKPDESNPFTFEERREMIKRALSKEGIHYKIYEIEDVDDNEKWAEEVLRLGHFDVAYSRNPWTVRCLKKTEIPVRPHEFYGKAKNSGTQIRKNMLEGKEWKNFVPNEVYEYIKEIRSKHPL